MNLGISIGDWVLEDHIPIFNENDLIEQIEAHTDETKIVLMRDVEVSIDTPLQAFNGTLDGNGYTITNVGTIANAVITAGNVYVGLFERINAGATVKNLVLDGIHINVSTTLANNSYAAILTAYNAGVVENITVKNSSVLFEHQISTQGIEIHVHASGLVGENGPNGNARVINSYSEATVTATVRKTGNVDRFISAYVGGLVGKNVSGEVLNSYATGNITGYASNTASGSSNDNRLAKVYAGSLVGFNDNWQGGTARVTNSFGVGSIHVSRITSGQGSARVRLFAGRLVGNDGGVITNGYRINSQTLAVATSTSNPTYVTHYNQGTSRTIVQLRSLTGTGLNTWDTTTIWRIHTDKYPTLRMEEI